MRSAWGIGLLLALSACAAQPDGTSPRAQVTPCPEERPQVCTMEYLPTCGILHDGSHREHASPCNACADDEVQAYATGSCPE